MTCASPSGLLQFRRSSSSARRCTCRNLDADAEVEFDDSAGARLESETVAGEWITSSNFNRGRPPTKKEVSVVRALGNPRHDVHLVHPRAGGYMAEAVTGGSFAPCLSMHHT